MGNRSAPAPAASPVRAPRARSWPRQSAAIRMLPSSAPKESDAAARPQTATESATSGTTSATVGSAERTRPRSYAPRARPASTASGTAIAHPPHRAQARERTLHALAERRAVDLRATAGQERAQRGRVLRTQGSQSLLHHLRPLALEQGRLRIAD